MKVTVVISALALLPGERSGKVGYEAVASHSQPSPAPDIRIRIRTACSDLPRDKLTISTATFREMLGYAKNE
jgi:hypothetical protein